MLISANANAIALPPMDAASASVSVVDILILLSHLIINLPINK